MTDEELWEDVHDIMGAGHETTATTTAAVLYCVSAHPEVARRVRDELSAVLGGAIPLCLSRSKGQRVCWRFVYFLRRNQRSTSPSLRSALLMQC